MLLVPNFGATMAAAELPDETEETEALKGRRLRIKGSNRPGTKGRLQRLHETGHAERVARYAATIAAGKQIFEQERSLR